MDFLKRNRKNILIVIMYIALFLVGREIYETRASFQEIIFLDFSRVMAPLLAALGCFWELYFSKKSDLS